MNPLNAQAISAHITNQFVAERNNLQECYARLCFHEAPNDSIVNALLLIPNNERLTLATCLESLTTNMILDQNEMESLLSKLLKIPPHERAKRLNCIQSLAGACSLIHQETSLYNIFNSVEKIPLKELDLYLELSLKLLIDNFNKFDNFNRGLPENLEQNQCNIIDSIREIPHENRLDAVNCLMEFFKNDDVDLSYNDFLDLLSHLPVGSIKDVFFYANEFLKDFPKDNHKASVRYRMLAESAYIYSPDSVEVQEIIACARFLFNDDHSKECRFKILSFIKDIKKSERAHVFLQAKKLITTNLSANDCIGILYLLSAIPEVAKREAAADHLKPFVGNPYMNLTSIHEIFSKISDENDINDIIKHTLSITESKPLLNTFFLINGLSQVPLDERQKLVEQLKLLKTNFGKDSLLVSSSIPDLYKIFIQSEEDFANIIKCINELNFEIKCVNSLIEFLKTIPANERTDVIKESNALIRFVQEDFQIVTFIRILSEIPAQNRNAVICHATPWIDHFSDKYRWPEFFLTYFRYSEKMPYKDVDQFLEMVIPHLARIKIGPNAVLECLQDIPKDKIETILEAIDQFTETIDHGGELVELINLIKELPSDDISDIMSYKWLWSSSTHQDTLRILDSLILLSAQQRKGINFASKYLDEQIINKSNVSRVLEQVALMLKNLPEEEWPTYLEPLSHMYIAFDMRAILPKIKDLTSAQRKDFLAYFERLNNLYLTSRSNKEKNYNKIFVQILEHLKPLNCLKLLKLGVDNQALYNPLLLESAAAQDPDVLTDFYLYLTKTLDQTISNFSKDCSGIQLDQASNIAKNFMEICKAYQLPEGIEISIQGFQAAITATSAKNPFKLYQRLHEILENEELIKEVGNWNLDGFRARCKKHIYTFADLPKGISYETLQNLVNGWKQCYKELSKDKRKEVKEYIRTLCDDPNLTINKAIAGILHKSEILRLFNLNGQDKERVDSLAFYLYKVIEDIAAESDEKQEGSPLTQKQESLLGLYRALNACTVGQQDGIVSCFNARSERFKDKQDAAIRPAQEKIEEMVDAAVQDTLKELLGVKNEMILRNLLKVDQVGQQVHLGRFLLNRLTKQFGWNELLFDLHTQVVPSELIEMKLGEALPIILGDLFTSSVLKTLQDSFLQSLQDTEVKKAKIQILKEFEKDKKSQLEVFEKPLEELKAEYKKLVDDTSASNEANANIKKQHDLKWHLQRIEEEEERLKSIEDVRKLRNEIDNIIGELREQETKVLSMVSGSTLYDFLGLKSMDQADELFEIDEMSCAYKSLKAAGAKALLHTLGYTKAF